MEISLLKSGWLSEISIESENLNLEKGMKTAIVSLIFHLPQGFSVKILPSEEATSLEDMRITQRYHTCWFRPHHCQRTVVSSTRWCRCAIVQHGSPPLSSENAIQPQPAEEHQEETEMPFATRISFRSPHPDPTAQSGRTLQTNGFTRVCSSVKNLALKKIFNCISIGIKELLDERWYLMVGRRQHTWSDW